VDEVSDLLLEVATENRDVAENPEPSVWLKEMGDNSINFELLAWTRTKLHRPGRFKSELNFAIVRKFREHGIEIPFPQRDLHIRSGLAGLERNGSNGTDAKAASVKS
jgi:small-conductance mechanosensitive channel